MNTTNNIEPYDIYELMITPPNKKAEMIVEELEKKDKANLNLVRDLIILGAELDRQDEYGSTALHYCVYNNHPDIARILIDAGANLNIQNNGGETTLHWCAYWNHIEILKMLIDAGANVNIQDKDGWTALHRSTRWNHPDIARILIDAGANVNVQDNLGLTPLHVCALTSNYDISPSNPKRFFILDDTNYISLEIAYILLEAGADVTIKDYSGKLPYNLTDNSDFLEILEP